MKYFYLAIAFIAGWAVAMYFHPYEQCKRNEDCSGVKYIPASRICADMYQSDEDIGECTWILENP